MGLSFDYDYKPWHGILFYLVSHLRVVGLPTLEEYVLRLTI